MAAQGRTRSLVGTSGASNDNGNSLAHPNDQICVLTVGLQFVAGGVQIGGSERGLMPWAHHGERPPPRLRSRPDGVEGGFYAGYRLGPGPSASVPIADLRLRGGRAAPADSGVPWHSLTAPSRRQFWTLVRTMQAGDCRALLDQHCVSVPGRGKHETWKCPSAD